MKVYEDEQTDSDDTSRVPDYVLDFLMGRHIDWYQQLCICEIMGEMRFKNGETFKLGLSRSA